MKRFRMILLAVTLAAAAPLRAQSPAPDSIGTSWRHESLGMRFVAEVVANGVAVPSGMAFLPDGRLLVADRSVGHLLLINVRTGAKSRLANVPASLGEHGAGMLDVAVHPAFATNGWIYFSYSLDRSGGATTAIARARIRRDSLIDVGRVFEAKPVIESADHFGGRMLFVGTDLYVTLGDRTARDLAQYPGDHWGKIVRLHDDGRAPRDNPFAGRAEWMPEIWTYGHRNPQGLAVNPATGELWQHEHGPHGGDELNVIERGKNYGWPLISWGDEYYGGPIGAGLTRRDGLEQPVRQWTPRIGPSGMLFYTGDKLPAWRGNLFIGAMAAMNLTRLNVDGRTTSREERLVSERRWRVRSLAQSPDGYLYLGVDGGLIVRLRAAP